MPPWEFERGGEVVRVNPNGRLVANTVELQVATAIAGLGILASFHEFLAPALADGRLEPVLADWWQRFPGPSLYYPSRRLMPTPLRAFVDFVKSDTASSSPA